MSEITKINERKVHNEEIVPKSKKGMPVLLLNILLMIISLIVSIWGIILVSKDGVTALGITILIVGPVYLFIVGPLLFAGLKVLKPNEALVLTLFGRYYGTLKGEGFYFVNPFTVAVNTATLGAASSITPVAHTAPAGSGQTQRAEVRMPRKKSH